MDRAIALDIPLGDEREEEGRGFATTENCSGLLLP